MLDTAVDSTIGEGEFLVLAPTADGLTIGFQRGPEHKAGKNRLHLDLVVADIDEATKEVERLGGRWLEPGTTRELEGFTWRCMADPEHRGQGGGAAEAAQQGPDLGPVHPRPGPGGEQHPPRRR